MGTLLGSVVYRFKIHKITPATGKERGDLEVKDYVVLQKPQAQDNHFPPPHTLIADFTMTLFDSGTHICTLWVNLRTQGAQTVLLTQMGL